MQKLLGMLFLILAIPCGLYVWLKWGWYDGFVLAFNAITMEPKSAGNFAWGVCKVLLGGALGGITFYLSIIIGGTFLSNSK